MKSKTARLKQKEELIEFLIWLSVEKRFPLNVKDVDKYLEAKGMCELMCPEPEYDNGFFYCPVCSSKSAVWQNDFDASDYGYDCEGIVSVYTCANCGAEIEATRLEREEDV